MIPFPLNKGETERGFLINSPHLTPALSLLRRGGIIPIFSLFCYTKNMDIKDVENLAELARIELSEDEKKEILSDMKGILEYVKQIEEVKLDVKHSVFNTINYNVWRGDETEPREFSHELIIKQFPDAQDGFLKVKKIL